MHYYSRNIGDYARDTGHLTVVEHGVYMLLLDWYYANERPITTKEAVRVSRGNPEAAHALLAEFFKETDEGWRHSYADREIEKFHARQERAKESGARGGRAKKANSVANPKRTLSQPLAEPKPTLSQPLANPTSVPSQPLANSYLTNNHKPITKNQEDKNPPTPLQGESPAGAEVPPVFDLTRSFEEWYAAYPKKQSPRDAERAYPKALATLRRKGRARDDPEAAAVLLGLTMTYAASPFVQTARKNKPSIVPYPATWLNAEGFLDDQSNWQQLVDPPRGGPRTLEFGAGQVTPGDDDEF